MKNPRDPLDDELKKRLDDYTEEPGDALWSGIASNIQSVPSSPAWIKPALWGTSLIVVSLITFVITRSIYNVEDKNSLAVQTVNEQPSSGVMNSNDSMSNKKDEVLSHDTKTNDTHNNELHNAEKKSANDQVPTDERSALPENHDGVETAIKNKKQTVVDKKSNTATAIASGKNSKNAPNDSGALVSPLKEEQISKTEKKEAVVPIVANTTIQDVGGSVADQSIQTESDKKIASTSSIEDVAMDSVSNLNPENPPKRVQPQAGEETADKDEKDKSDKKLNLYFTAMPTFGYNRIEANKDDNVMIESIGKVSNFSAKRLGIRAEFGAEYAVSRRTRIFAGVLYYQRKQTIEYVEKTVTNVMQERIADTTIVFDPEYSYEDKKFEYELKNIGVQVGINYVLSKGKFVHYAGTGIEFHKALNKLPENSSEFGSAPSTYVFYNLYYRLQYPAKGKLRAIFQPTFNYSLYLNQDMNAPFYVKPYGLGLNVGVTYSF